VSVALRVDQLTVTARSAGGDQLILDHVDLEIAQGEILGVVGESGSGKTTLVRTITGLLDRNLSVTAGAVELLGSVVLGVGVDRTETVRGTHVGVVFQDASRSLNPVLRVGSQLHEVLARHRRGTSRAEARELMMRTLQEMSIADPERAISSYPHQLSGGQRQRVALALAMITHPELILADECTTALDVTTQAEVVALLRRIVESQAITLVFVTHDLLLAAELCDRIAVMYAGQVVETGPATEVLVRPRHPYTERLLTAIPSWDLATPLQGIPGAAPHVTPEFRGCRFAERCPRAEPDCREVEVELDSETEGHDFRCLHPVADLRPRPVIGITGSEI
jgi:oligopeptide/dipeptide ABC transporter ATP-binding protein